MANFRAPDVGLKHLVAPHCASGDPISCPVKEPMALFVERAYK